MPDLNRMKKLWQPPFWGYKICAVILALLVWSYVIVTQNPMTELSYTVTVEMRNLDSSLAIPETNRQVSVTVQGSGTVLTSMTRSQICAYVDFTGAEAGEVTLPVHVDNLPDGITLASVMPESLSYELEAVISKSFPVEVRMVGDAADDCTLLEPVLEPELVTLSGSADSLSQVSSVFVTADISGISSGFDKNLAVEVQDAAGTNISGLFGIAPGSVQTMIPVVTTQPEKSVAISPVITGTPAVGYQVSRVVVMPATVRAFGDLSQLNQLYYIETEPVDVTGLKKNASFNMDLVRPNGITTDHSTVNVVVQIEPTHSAVITKDGLLHLEGLIPELVCEVPSMTIEITVSGPQTDIAALQDVDVVPYIDMSGITEPGTYSLPVKVALPANISPVSTDPEIVSLVVTEAELPPEGEAPADGETVEE